MRGRYKWMVLDEHGRVERESPEFKNLLTDAFLDYFGDGTLSWQATTGGIRAYLAVGDAGTEPKADSGTVTASQSGTTVTASSGFFSAGDVGDVIVWDSGEHARITSYTSSTAVEVDESKAVSSDEFKIWRVGTVSLGNQLLESFSDGAFPAVAEYDTVGGEFVASITLTRVVTMDVNRTINEWALYPGSGDVAVYDVIRDGGGNPTSLSINAGKKFAVQHTLEVTAPFNVAADAFAIDEYDITDSLVGSTNYTVDAGLYSTTGANLSFLGNLLNFATTNVRGELRASDWTPATTLDVTLGSNFALDAPEAYVPGAFTRDRTFTVPEGQGNYDSYGYLVYVYEFAFTNHRVGFQVHFTSPATFTKANTHTLTLGVTLMWDRDYA